MLRVILGCSLLLLCSSARADFDYQQALAQAAKRLSPVETEFIAFAISEEVDIQAASVDLYQLFKQCAQSHETIAVLGPDGDLNEYIMLSALLQFRQHGGAGLSVLYISDQQPSEQLQLGFQNLGVSLDSEIYLTPSTLRAL